MTCPYKMDLHIHTTTSDGTDTPAEIMTKVKAEGIALFSVTDHDAVSGCAEIRSLLRADDPSFILGVEFSCEDEEGKYHILGYGYDPSAASVRDLVATARAYRLDRMRQRVDHLEKKYGFALSWAEWEELFSVKTPGKPHLADLMLRRGFVSSREEAFERYLNTFEGKEEHVRPEDAIRALTEGGGIPILAHPSFGDGKERIVGAEMERRLMRLMTFGLHGIEAFYSGFSEELQRELLSFADRHHLYVTAGSDYHGDHKTVPLGYTHLDAYAGYPEGLRRFLQDVKMCKVSAR